jgi:N4-(beta-N-acetylglucosaminyl)-L-asparaginase
MAVYSRRKLMQGGMLAAMAAPLSAQAGQGPGAAAVRPVAISSANGLRAVQKAVEMIQGGGDTLDAVIAGVNIVEDDPNDSSVGYGGLPNEDGVVELDASVMHGPTRRAGAVGSLRNFKNPSKVAKVIMEHTDHLLLVGEGALRFARMHGFEEMNLLTDRSRLAWLTWKARTASNWGPGLAAPETGEKAALGQPDAELLAWAREVAEHPPTGTINCLAVDSRGDLSGVTTTSGLAWKIPGRVGDSPLIGCGLFVDNEVGGAGSTGRGEECIKINGAHTVVEMMRRGASPREACLEAVKRVAANYRNDRTKLAQMDINFYALNKRGEHGAAALWNAGSSGKRKSQYAVNDGGASRLVESAYLLER